MRSFIAFFFHCLTFNLQLNQTAVQLIDDFRLRVDFNFDFGSCFINQINGLVRQKSIGDVAMAKLCRCHDGRIGNVNAVVNFVLFLQATQNGNGSLHTGLAHQDLLKTALKGGIFFDVLTIFVQGGGTHTVQLTPCQCRLEHVARVHGTFRLASAHHGVQLIDEHNGLTFIFGQLVQDRFKALFKLSAKLCAGEQGCHVQR